MHHFGVGELYFLTRPPSDMRFVKILAEGSESIYIRPFKDPPKLRWWTEPGIPMVRIEPQPADRFDTGVGVLEVSRDQVAQWGPVFLQLSGGVDGDEHDAVDEAELARISIIPDTLLAQVLSVEPSRNADLEYRPCRVQLRSGKLVDRVYVVEAEPYRRDWGIWPRHDRYKAEILLSDISKVEESPNRLPAALATKMYEAGESAMGGSFFVVVLRDGTRIPFGAGNAVDFLEFPAGVAPADVIDLLPHERAAPGDLRQTDGGAWSCADFSWCLYRRA